LSAIDARRLRAWELAEEGGMDEPQLRARLEEIDADRARLAGAIDGLQAPATEWQPFTPRTRKNRMVMRFSW
jgi:hypothetical protein